VQRHEGIAFNQRYLLEVLPLAAIGFAWALNGAAIQVKGIVAGGAVGAVAAGAILGSTPSRGEADMPLWLIRHVALLKVPILLALALGIVWWHGRWRGARSRRLGITAGLCLGWSLAVHVLEDVDASRRLRGQNLMRTRALGGALTDGSAVLTYWGAKDAVVPLLINRDIVVLDARADEGMDAPVLIHQLLARGRRVFILRDGFPPAMLSHVVAAIDAVPVSAAGGSLMELRREVR
jgi:hypothetical protein